LRKTARQGGNFGNIVASLILFYGHMQFQEYILRFSVRP
jgi:hypothetical protein